MQYKVPDLHVQVHMLTSQWWIWTLVLLIALLQNNGWMTFIVLQNLVGGCRKQQQNILGTSYCGNYSQELAKDILGIITFRIFLNFYSANKVFCWHPSLRSEVWL